ncbi:MAG TPA: lipoate--protein ligase family protein [Candidatus Binatia bacterium]|jgi:lipoate-protein ligase A|nr:lipoate--protein ligase family protein [Candidatus Binatia bacterium]
MKYLDLTFANPATNLACDEALLELYESEKTDDALLRVWEPRDHFVVLGHSNRLHSEVNISACRRDQVSILRRVSGGGAVMQGPGCLNYCLILSSQALRLRSIGAAFRYVLARHCRFIGKLAGVQARIEGFSDLTVAGRKFSGNAQYRKARYVLVHGTFLLNFDLSMIARFLRMPAKQPAYRQRRPHLEFITNLNLTSMQVRDCIRDGWNAVEKFSDVPLARIEALVTERYGREEWSKKF